MTSMQLPNAPAFRTLLEWLRGLSACGRFGLVRTPAGDEFVVMRPEQLLELESILSDPAFVRALETGVDDALKGRVSKLQAGRELSDLLAQAPPLDASMADAIERGVDDAKAGRVTSLPSERSLDDLL